MTPIYLSADNPRWTPKTETDLRRAIDGGLIKESHHLDLKKVPATKGDNRESAKDMVSFAIDSGTLIMGVAEDKQNRTFTLAPQPLNGLAEQVEEIARNVPEPPLTILTEEIPSDADPTRGYLVVHIPASPAAPHMVDGKYYGRGDKTKYVLSDAEVSRLHERRRVGGQDALSLLQHEIDRDPIPADPQRSAHLFLVAQPLAGRRDMLLDLVSGEGWDQRLGTFSRQAQTPDLEALLRPYSVEPSLRQADRAHRRARGAALTTYNLGEGRTYTPTTSTVADKVVELSVHEDGGLRVFFSRFSDILNGDHLAPDGRRVLLDVAAAAYTRRFLSLVLAAAEYGAYFGNWALAFGATGLSGLRTYSGMQSFGYAESTRYDEDHYAETTEATWAELTTTPGAITQRLVGRLLRAFAVEKRYEPLLHDSSPPRFMIRR
ncbi:helix-turn-helix domain-containing protein [Nonomuraea sp. NPDC050478]|uniref:helix-turn-helix domain-containing protein n=1 Tax=Nonomuraea sp. NPDC050478 TaxID=3364365 RepID=UPI0037A60963